MLNQPFVALDDSRCAFQHHTAAIYQVIAYSYEILVKIVYETDPLQPYEELLQEEELLCHG
jgi:hypothetical protein